MILTLGDLQLLHWGISFLTFGVSFLRLAVSNSEV